MHLLNTVTTIDSIQGTAKGKKVWLSSEIKLNNERENVGKREGHETGTTKKTVNIYWDNKQISLKTRGTKSSLCEERLVGSVTASPLLLPLTLAE